MSRNKIKDLSKEEIISGFLYCHDNAKKLLEAGKLLFNNKFTAYANSLLILAVEEEIKGCLTCFRGNQIILKRLERLIFFGEPVLVKLFSKPCHQKQECIQAGNR